MTIAVGQWLVSGLQWSSSAQQSLAARQKEVSEYYRLILKWQNCIENRLNLCYFLTSLSSFFFSFIFLFLCFFFSTTKWAFNWMPWRPAPYGDDNNNNNKSNYNNHVTMFAGCGVWFASKLSEGRNEWMNEWMNGRMQEWMKEWINEWVNGATRELFLNALSVESVENE